MTCEAGAAHEDGPEAAAAAPKPGVPTPAPEELEEEAAEEEEDGEEDGEESPGTGLFSPVGPPRFFLRGMMVMGAESVRGRVVSWR